MMRLFTLAATALALAACQVESVEQSEPAPRPVAFAVAEERSTAETRRLPGEVRPIDRAPLSFDVGGQITELPLEIGDHFEEGEVIAAINPNTLRMELSERESELAEAQAELREAEAEFRRQEQLFEDGWVSRAGFDTALSARETAESRVARRRASLGIAEDNLEDATLEAPYSGTVARRLAEPSQRVAAGEAVYEIQGNGGGVEVSVSVPETLVDRIDRDAVHTVTIPARPGLRLNGRVREIGAEAASANAFTVTLGVDEAPADMRTGLTAEVTLSLRTDPDRAGTVAVPVVALVYGENDSAFVFVIDREAETVSRQRVSVARVAEERAFLKSGVRAGDTVVARGAAFLSDGQAVRLLGDGPARYSQ